MPNKLTDTEIKKALECCAINSSCTDIPLRKTKSNCGDYFLDLFNRKDAEIESLKAEVERLADRSHKCIYLSDDETTEYCVDGPCPKYKTETQIKSEAYKEFAERLKDESEHFELEKENFVSENQIDNLLNELVGGIDG